MNNNLKETKKNSDNENKIVSERKDESKENCNNDKGGGEEIKKDEENKNNNNNNDNSINKDLVKIEIEEKKENDPLLNIMNSNRKISDKEIKDSTKLILEEIDGHLFKGQKIEINAAGMIGGRGLKDGFAIFGQKDPNKVNENDIDNENKIEEKKNDNLNESKNDDSPFKPDFEINYNRYLSYPYIFAIYYSKEEKNFYIRAFSGKGSDNKVLFVKLSNEYDLPLNQKEIISTGDIIFQITPLDNNCIEIINLTKKKNNPVRKQIFDGLNRKTVTIGRHKECDFSFPRDKSFSRYQTTFEFNEFTKQWTIIDGTKNKSSTNGTWVFGTHSFKIKENMIVEILNSRIKITQIKNSEA